MKIYPPTIDTLVTGMPLRAWESKLSTLLSYSINSTELIFPLEPQKTFAMLGSEVAENTKGSGDCIFPGTFFFF